MQLAACYLMYESVKSHPASICRTESDYKMASDHSVNIRSRLRSSSFPAREFLAYINVYDRKSDSKSLGVKLILFWWRYRNGLHKWKYMKRVDNEPFSLNYICSRKPVWQYDSGENVTGQMGQITAWLEEEIVPPRRDGTASETVKVATDGGVRETFQDTRGT